MSNSINKTAICGHCAVRSEAKDKKLWHRAFRHANNNYCQNYKYQTGFILDEYKIFVILNTVWGPRFALVTSTSPDLDGKGVKQAELVSDHLNYQFSVMKLQGPFKREIVPHFREHSNTWSMAKDGKGWVSTEYDQAKDEIQRTRCTGVNRYYYSFKRDESSNVVGLYNIFEKGLGLYFLMNNLTKHETKYVRKTSVPILRSGVDSQHEAKKNKFFIKTVKRNNRIKYINTHISLRK